MNCYYKNYIIVDANLWLMSPFCVVLGTSTNNSCFMSLGQL